MVKKTIKNTQEKKKIVKDNPTDSAQKPEEQKEATELPILPLRDVVFFPGDYLPVFVGRRASLAKMYQLQKICIK